MRPQPSCSASALAMQFPMPCSTSTVRPSRGRRQRKRQTCVAASGNGNGNGNGSVSTAARDKFAEEQSETAKMTQASILRKRAADALAAQRKLMQELQEQEARFATLDAALAEARAQAAAANRALSSDQIATDAVWAAAQTEVLARDPWSASVNAPPAGGESRVEASWMQKAWAQWTAQAPAAPSPVEAEKKQTTRQSAGKSEPVRPAPAPAPSVDSDVGKSFLEVLAAAASSTIARLTSPDARARQMDGVRLKLKSDLLLKVANLDRGARANTADKLDVEGLLASLSSVNPTPQPARSPLSDGRWNVVYTTSTQLLGTRMPPLLRPAGPLYVSFNSTENLAALDTVWPVTAQRAVMKVTSSSGISLDWTTLKVFGFFSLPVSDPKARDTAFLDTIYLDLDMRIMRGQNGTVFVLIQDDPFYKIKDGDRGVARQGALPAGRSNGTGSRRSNA